MEDIVRGRQSPRKREAGSPRQRSDWLVAADEQPAAADSQAGEVGGRAGILDEDVAAGDKFNCACLQIAGRIDRTAVGCQRFGMAGEVRVGGKPRRERAVGSDDVVSRQCQDSGQLAVRSGHLDASGWRDHFDPLSGRKKKRLGRCGVPVIDAADDADRAGGVDRDMRHAAAFAAAAVDVDVADDDTGRGCATLSDGGSARIDDHLTGANVAFLVEAISPDRRRRIAADVDWSIAYRVKRDELGEAAHAEASAGSNIEVARGYRDFRRTNRSVEVGEASGAQLHRIAYGSVADRETRAGRRLQSSGGHRTVDGDRSVGGHGSQGEHDVRVEIVAVVAAPSASDEHRDVGHVDAATGGGGDGTGSRVASDQGHDEIAGGEIAGGQVSKRCKADIAGSADVADGD